MEISSDNQKLWHALTADETAQEQAVNFELIERAPLGTTMGHERMFFDLPSAVERYEKMRDAIAD
jgi:hypothetical protein